MVDYDTSKESGDARGTASAERGVFMSNDGRLPDFTRCRLDALVDKKKFIVLNAVEEQELVELLDFIDEASLKLLTRATGRT